VAAINVPRRNKVRARQQHTNLHTAFPDVLSILRLPEQG